MSLLDDIENRFLGERVIGKVYGFRVDRKGQIGKRSCRDIEDLARRGFTITFMQVGEFPTYKFKVWSTPPTTQTTP